MACVHGFVAGWCGCCGLFVATIYLRELLMTAFVHIGVSCALAGIYIVVVNESFSKCVHGVLLCLPPRMGFKAPRFNTWRFELPISRHRRICFPLHCDVN